ncbi:MAG: histidine kinase [bacterium]
MNEDPHQASKYLSRFSKLVRNILDSSVEDFVTLEEEISTINNYLELQKLRYKDKFDYRLVVDESIDTKDIHIPPMLAQPFIENSIEHGIKNKSTTGHIDIRFYRKNDHIVCEIEDDGVGREKAREILYRHDKSHRSLGTTITFERIKVLNKKFKRKIRPFIRDLKDANDRPIGTLVRIEMPVG